MAMWYNIQQLRPLGSPTAAEHHQYTLVNVSIFFRDSETITGAIPCYSCAGFACFEDYYAYAEGWLADTIYRHHSSHVPQHQATRIAEDIICDVLGQEGAHTVYTVYINICHLVVNAVEFDVDRRAIMESFEEAGPKMKGATLDSLIGLYAVRCGQESEEEVDRRWSESEHECVICMDEIEKHCESLTMPCKHVFHETCLMRWLDNNNVCPLCRCEMPEEEEDC